MNLLGFDTSTEYCSIGICSKEKTSFYHEKVGRKHTEILISGIQKLLISSNLEVSDLDAISYNKGPGSFTGLRLACSVAQGLCCPYGIPLIPITSIETISCEYSLENIIYIEDARLGEVLFCAVSFNENKLKYIFKPILCSPKNTPNIPKMDWLFAGSGFDKYQEIFRKKYTNQIKIEVNNYTPHVKFLLTLGRKYFLENKIFSDHDLLPFYTRKKVALELKEQQERKDDNRM